MTTPNPGSDEAVSQGCLCPILDNAKGKGAWGDPGTFWIAPSCPLHGDLNECYEKDVPG